MLKIKSQLDKNISGNTGIFLLSFQIKFWLLEFIMRAKIGLMICEVWMRVKNKKDGNRTFVYSGDLEKEIAKVGKQLVSVEK